MLKKETKNFQNDGFGWKCKRCKSDLINKDDGSDKEISRLMTEGEAESKFPRFSTTALAKWTDEEQNILLCPRCGIKEQIKN